MNELISLAKFETKEKRIIIDISIFQKNQYDEWKQIHFNIPNLNDLFSLVYVKKKIKLDVNDRKRIGKFTDLGYYNMKKIYVLLLRMPKTKKFITTRVFSFEYTRFKEKYLCKIEYFLIREEIISYIKQTTEWVKNINKNVAKKFFYNGDIYGKNLKKEDFLILIEKLFERKGNCKTLDEFFDRKTNELLNLDGESYLEYIKKEQDKKRMVVLNDKSISIG